MLPHERRKQMVHMLQTGERATVRDMAQHLGVTPETVRRDLRQLEQQKIVQRVHGGAQLLTDGEAALPIATRRIVNSAEKRAIAAAAIELIEDGDVIALDASTTVLELARKLDERSVSVLTYGLNIAQMLGRFPHVQVHVVGGVLYKPEGILVGSEAVDALRRLRVTKAFMSCTGIDPDYGLTISGSLEADVKRALLSSAERVCLLADSNKFARRGLVSYAKIEDVHTVITDDNIGAAHLNMLQQRGIEVLTAPISQSKQRDSDKNKGEK